MFKQPAVGKPVIFLVLLMAVMFIAGQADAQTKISGKMTMAYTIMDTIAVGDTDGHNMALGESKGTNTSTGAEALMDGAESINLSYADLTKGSGPHQGYVTLKKGDNMTVAKWKGEVKTTMTAEGAPKTAFNGTFEYIKGAGKFKGIKGAGTYEGYFTSKTEYVAEWKGEYSLK